jgi:hypothetical protein
LLFKPISFVFHCLYVPYILTMYKMKLFCWILESSLGTCHLNKYNRSAWGENVVKKIRQWSTCFKSFDRQYTKWCYNRQYTKLWSAATWCCLSFAIYWTFCICRWYSKRSTFHFYTSWQVFVL